MATVQIFLASSAELKADREAFELFINRKNKEGQSRGIFFELIIWEDFLDAVSPTRSQDEYNKAIRECDLFVLLFFTKAGKYTEEEFDKAYQQFKATGKPLIFTYFKDALITTGSISNEVLSLLAFKEKLRVLEHFFSTYRNEHELLLDFNGQLEKLAAKGTIKLPESSGAATLPKELTLTLPRTDPRDIVGREDDLQELHNLLSTEERVVVVNGIGGVGKTTLAQAYLSRYYEQYKHLAWITHSPSGIAADILNTAGLLSSLGMEGVSGEPQKVFEAVLLKMRNLPEGPNLLIIDNAEQTLSKYWDVMPRQPLWHLLVTSREQLNGFHSKVLDFLNEEQAIALFNRHYTRRKLSEQDIIDLVRTVDYHTLTIEILAKTAQVQRHYDVATLKQAIEQDARANMALKRDGYATIEKVGSYLVTVFNSSRLNDEEILLLKRLVCLPPEYHPYDLLRELLINNDGEHISLFSETLEEVTRKGWLLHIPETDSYKMHRIVAEVVKRQHPVREEDVKVLLLTITQKLAINQSKDNPVDKFLWMPFGKTLLAGLGEQMSNVIAMLQNNFASVLNGFGDYLGAKEGYQKALCHYETTLGENHKYTSILYSNLAMALKDLDELQEAKSLLQKAVQSDERNCWPEHPNTVRDYYNMAIVLRRLGELQEAKTLLEKAVQSDERNFGPEHPNTIRGYSNMAIVLYNLGELQEAKTLLEKAVKCYEETFGYEHLYTAALYHNLATVLCELSEDEVALQLMGKAWAVKIKVLPEGHPDIISSGISYKAIKDKLDNRQTRE